MAVRGWVLVQTEVGHARSVADAVARATCEGARVLASDTVTGPHDVIVRLEADDLDRLNAAVVETIESVPGVQHTITCLAIRPA
jgi:DNA-binding Lrp family transcriptional regulator